MRVPFRPAQIKPVVIFLDRAAGAGFDIRALDRVLASPFHLG
ncbi:MAG: hypothetical protein N2050_08195 [Flavobacteriales bacterium]|nr:hypothetical protein [Flavobacteriales bacterium]